MTTDTLINNLFDLLDDWRSLPAYQLERRADIFFAIYLKDIIKHKFENEVEYIIPEFPVRKGHLAEPEVSSDNLSFKIDYLAVSESSKTVFLIELKTDNLSIRKDQKETMEKIGKFDISILTDSVLKISKASKSIKYEALINKLTEMGWLDKEGKIVSKQDYTIKVVYIKPSFNDKTDIGLDIITFKEVIDSISQREDSLTQRFIKSLERWQPSEQEK